MCQNRAEEAFFFCKAGRTGRVSASAYFTLLCRDMHACHAVGLARQQWVPENFLHCIRFNFVLAKHYLIHAIHGDTVRWRMDDGVLWATLDRLHFDLALDTVDTVGCVSLSTRAVVMIRLEFNRSGSSCWSTSLACHIRTTSSDRTPISHDPDNGAWACNVHKLPVVSTRLLSSLSRRRAAHLFVPAEEYAHGLATTLAAAPRMDLGEASGLRRDVAGATCRVRLCHSLVAVEKTISRLPDAMCVCV